MDESNRMITWSIITGQGLLKEVTENAQEFLDVSFIATGSFLQSFLYILD